MKILFVQRSCCLPAITKFCKENALLKTRGNIISNAGVDKNHTKATSAL